MEVENYIQFLEQTIKSYPIKIKKHLKQMMVDKGIAQDQDQLSLDNVVETSIDVRELELTEKVCSCIRGNENAIKLYEQFEYTKDYKYSILFMCDSFNKLLAWVESIPDLTNKQGCENMHIHNRIEDPIAHSVNENTLMIKFDLGYSAVDSLTAEELMLKYPILIVLHKQNQVIEFRFDSIKRVFLSERQQQTIYTDIVTGLKSFISESTGCYLVPLDLQFMIANSQNEIEGIVPLAQYRRLPNGGNAQLEVGRNERYVLPIIGELKELLSKYQSELEKVPSLQQAFDQFIYENDELADYGWIEVMWENEIKTRQVSVKFTFNYLGGDYCLIQHYHNNVLVGMERMDRVTEYIIKHKDNTSTENN